MSSKLLVICALSAAVSVSGCAGMSDTQKRTATGAAVGAAAGGIISGEWGWAAGGAAIGAVGGYLYDQHKKSEEEAYQRGLRDGKTR